ncbi:signal peptidase I [Streptomyces sp. NPDC088748]|uniref:signal peptidase I n=1 Tax=Streptomyces sp. NPDC088748 TaxID=3365887 RepID=UPI003806D82B
MTGDVRFAKAALEAGIRPVFTRLADQGVSQHPDNTGAQSGRPAGCGVACQALGTRAVFPVLRAVRFGRTSKKGKQGVIVGEQGRRPGHRLGVAAVTLLVLGGVLSCVGGLGGYFFMATRIMPSDHMRPTLPAGTSMTFNTLAIGVDRGDVVLFDAAAWGERHLSVERVIAVGGDRIAYIPGERKLTLNGKPLDEPYVLNGDPVAGTPGAFDVKVPEGRLFLLGDTRGNSADSRYRFEVSEGGTAPLSAVKGKLIGEGDPLVVGLRSALPAGGGAVLAGVVAGVAARRLRRRTMTAGAPTADTVRVSGDRVPAELPARTSARIPPVLK